MQIRIHASGRGIDLPIYVEREEMDLRLCMMDQLYQDSVIVNNRWNFKKYFSEKMLKYYYIYLSLSLSPEPPFLTVWRLLSPLSFSPTWKLSLSMV